MRRVRLVYGGVMRGSVMKRRRVVRARLVQPRSTAGGGRRNTCRGQCDRIQCQTESNKQRAAGSDHDRGLQGGRVAGRADSSDLSTAHAPNGLTSLYTPPDSGK